MTPRRKRLAIILGIVASVGVAAALVLNAFQSNLVFFYSPTQVAAREAPTGRTFRLGGLVKDGSVKRDGVVVRFDVTDTVQTIPVRYQGILPDLFKEGKGVVAQGQVGPDGIFVAREVLAKHDENYMPPEAADALKRAAEVNKKIGSSVVKETPREAEALAAPLKASATTPLLLPETGNAEENCTPTVIVAGPVPEAGETVIQGWFGVAVQVTLPGPA